MANRLLSVVVMLVFFASIASAQQIYKWKDEKGQWHFSDAPPVGGDKKVLPTGLFSTKKRKEVKKIPPSKYDDVLDAVVQIASSHTYGSGFFVTNDGLIVTNYHITGDEGSVKIKIRKQKEIVYGSVVARDVQRDLALVSVSGEGFPWLRLGMDNNARIGAEVFAIGAPEGLEWTLTRGVVSAVRDFWRDSEWGVPGKVRVVQTDAALNMGNSGGPLVSAQGLSVVGVNTFGFKKDLAEGLSFAVSSEEILKAFRAYLKGK